MTDIPALHLECRQFPEEERDNVFSLAQQLRQAGRFCDDFQAALSLFETCRSQISLMGEVVGGSRRNESRMYFRWQTVACRDGGMTIHHFATTLSGLEKAICFPSTFADAIDFQKLRAANDLFKISFPHFNALRNSIAHAAEPQQSVKQLKRHSFSGTFSDGHIAIEQCTNIIVAGLHGRNFTTTWKGEILSYEMSSQTAQKLRDVLQLTYAALRGLRLA